MLSPSQLAGYRVVQNAAKAVLAELGGYLSPTATEGSIAAEARRLLALRGISETWYYNVPALVLAGSRSCLSVSGRNYTPATEAIGTTNLITVDLSPEKNGLWGDCARTLAIENGRVTAEPEDDAFRDGIDTVMALHKDIVTFVTQRTTFHELHAHANRLIAERGYENLDFQSNVGHSIERHLNARVYVEAGNHARLSDAALFTFEPHVRAIGGRWGFKHENIYYFDEQGCLAEL